MQRNYCYTQGYVVEQRTNHRKHHQDAPCREAVLFSGDPNNTPVVCESHTLLTCLESRLLPAPGNSPSGSLPGESRAGRRIPPLPLEPQGRPTPPRTKGAQSCTSDKMQRPFWSPPTCPRILPPAQATRRSRLRPGGLRSGPPKQAAGPRDGAHHPSSAHWSSPARAGQQSRPCPGAGPRPAVTDENPPREQLPSKSSLTRKEPES